MIRHLVLFNFKESATDEQMAAVVRSAQRQLTQIPGVCNLAISRAIAPYTESPYGHALTMEFADEAALAVYMDHPLHQEFRKVFSIARRDIISMDFAELEASE